MTKLALLSAWAHRRRLAGTALAVVLGVAFLTGTLVLGDTLQANFDRMFTEVSAGTSVVVRNSTAVDTERQAQDARGQVPASVLRTVRSVPGVAAAEGQVVGFGTLLGRDGEPIGGNGPPRLAGSWMRDEQLNPYRLVEGRAPRAGDEVVVNRGAAKAGDLHVGDTTTLQSPQPVRVRIVGIATFGDSDGLGQTTFTAFTLAGAQQHVTGRPDELSTIAVRADAGVSESELRDRIRAALPAGTEAITGQQLTDERLDEIASTFLDMLRTLLVAFAGIALVVATLTISNTFSITVAQRTRELALLRAVGASRRQVRAAVALEAALIGTVAAAVGVVAGLGVAGLLKGLFDSFGFALPAGGMTIRPTALAIGLLAGVVATVLAAQLPARRASAVTPIAALAGASAERSTIGRVRTGAGIATLGLGLAVGLAGAFAGSFLAAALGSLALVAGALLIAPVLVRPVAGLAGRGLRRGFGAAGLLAEQNARRSPRRSAATATALLVGVAVVSLFTMFVASLRETLDDQLRAGITADLVVSSPSFGGGQLSPSAVVDLRARPEVATAVGLGGGQALADGETTTVVATDPDRIADVLDVTVTAGSLRGLGTDELAVSVDEARERGWRIGSPVTFTFAGGATERMTVGALYDDADLLGEVVLPTAVWAEHELQPMDSLALLTTRPGVSGADARRALAPLAESFGGDLETVAGYAESSAGGLDLLLNLVYVMLALAIVIALLGIANTLSLAVYERRAELGLLRAVGETRGQVRSMLRLEAVVLAGFGTVLGLVLGGALGWILFVTVSDSSTFVLPVVPLAVITVLGAASGALAAFRPSRRAAKTPILDAIATT